MCCRFRPQNGIEKTHNGKICVEVPDNGNSVYLPASDQTFVLDKVFRWDTSQKEVYEYAAKPIISAVLKGFNGTVFAYGQTGSGKTFTMEGTDIEDKVHQGVIPRMVWSIFDGIYHADEHIEFLVKVSIVEIYNERIRDLLDPKKDNLKVHEDKTRGVFIAEVTESYVASDADIFDAMRAGTYNRAMAMTQMNEHSSRSHLVFMLTIEQKNLHDKSMKVGKLYLVDLAGSETVGKTGAAGVRLEEAKNINRSLSALGNVINALTASKVSHIPYRDSKLTRVLQESLGGNAKTSLIVTCSPSNFNEPETISTLRFGQRAKMIKNVVKINQERSVEEMKLLLDKRELALAELRGRLNLLEQTLRTHKVPIPEGRGELGAAPAPAIASSDSSVDLLEQLQDKKDELKRGAERVTELNIELEETQRQLRTVEEDNKRIVSKMEQETGEVERLQYEKNEMNDQVEKLKHDNQTLLEEIEELHKSNSSLLQTSQSAERDAERADEDRPRHKGSEDDGERLKDVDRPLKRKVSQLDKNLEQLTVMYHKLVAQNSGLKVEVNENDKKIQRKDQRISQLERNLREAKQKYEKLLTQCANLTAMMDTMGRTKSIGGPGAAPGGSHGAVPRRSNIVRPMRGGLAPTGDPAFQPPGRAFSESPGPSSRADRERSGVPVRESLARSGTRS